MNFLDHPRKGLARCLVDEDLGIERLRVHISEVGPGTRSHPPHQHEDVEAFYMLEGEGTLEIDGASQLVRAGEAIMFDATKLHGLVNTGTTQMRYMVILTPR